MIETFIGLRWDDGLEDTKINTLKEMKKSDRKTLKNNIDRLMNGEYLNEIEKYNMTFAHYSVKVKFLQDYLLHLERKETKRKWKSKR